MIHKYSLPLAQSGMVSRRVVTFSLVILISILLFVITLLEIGIAGAAPSTQDARPSKSERNLAGAAVNEEIAYIAVSNQDYLALVDLVAGSVVDTVDLQPSGCSFPWRVAIPPDGQSVWVSCRYSDTVIVLDRSSNEILHTYSEQQSPADIAFTQDSAFALIGTRSYGDVLIVDTSSVTQVTSVETDNYPVSIVMHPFLPIAYAVHQVYDGAVSVIDTTSWTVTQQIKAGYSPHHAVISHDGSRLYLSNKEGYNVSVIDTAALNLVTDIAIDTMPRGLAITPDDQTLYVTRSWGDAIAIIDTASNSVQQTLDITSNEEFDRPWGMDLTCAGETLVTTNSGGWDEENRQIALTDTGALSTVLLPLPDSDGDGSPDTGARGLAVCPQYVPENIFFAPPVQSKQGNRGEEVTYSTTLLNFTRMEDSYTLAVGPHDWDTVLSTANTGPLLHGETANLTVTVTVPHDADWFSSDSVVITATSVVSPTVYEATATLHTQAYAPPMLTVSPLSLTSTQQVGEAIHQTLDIANGAGVDLEFELGTSLGPGTSFSAASTELYGYIVPGAYIRVVALSDDTHVQLIDLSTGSLIEEISGLAQYETWNVYPGSETYFKLLSNKAIVAVEQNSSYWGFDTFIPSLATGPVGREFVFYHEQGDAWLYLFAIEDTEIEIFDGSENLYTSKSLDAGDYWKLNPDSGVYHIFATGRIALETVAENAYTTVPSTDGQGTGNRFYFATTDWENGAVAVFAYQDTDIELFDLDDGSLLYSTHLEAGENWWQIGLENRGLRLESSGDVEVWAGNTEGGQDIEHLGDDISFAGGRLGREFYLHSLQEGFVIFAPFENTQVSIDDTSYSLEKDDYLHFPDCCAFHKVIANQPILIQTLGRDGSWNDFGTYLGGVVAHSGEIVPWLVVDPISGQVPTSSSLPIDVNFDATGIQPGLHQASLLLASNDPTHPFMEIAADMQVNPTVDMGRVSGSVTDLWTGQPLVATLALEDVHTTLADPNFEIWAVADSYTLTASKDGYIAQELSIDINAGAITPLDIELEPDLPRLDLVLNSLSVEIIEGSTSTTTLTLDNTGPALLDISIFELPSVDSREMAALSDIKNRKILFDRAHNEPQLSDYDALVTDLVSAGATVDQNFVFPIDASVLDGYDVLWINCCGNSWTFAELTVLKSWLEEGGAILIHGGENSVTTDVAGIYGIEYQSGCSYGTSTDIKEHPITVGVNSVFVDTCSYLTFGSSSVFAVGDTQGQPHVVAHEQDSGKMVVVAGTDFQDYRLDEEDNRLLAHNIFVWLAEPGYTDISWLKADPASLQISGHSSKDITIHFDAGNLHEGVFEAFLAVEHNDPDQDTPAKLPVTLTVGESVGRIVVDKQTNPSGDLQSFIFTLIGGPEDIELDFALSDEADPWESGLIKTGVYNLSESLPSGWVQTAATCDDGSDPASIQLGQGETVTCTFGNRKLVTPGAKFSASPISGIPPMAVQFTNLSSGDFDQCLWDFGDGGSANICSNPSHTYNKPGSFTVSLKVKGLGGEAIMTREDYIRVYAPPAASFAASPTSGVSPLTVKFTNLSTGDFESCLWDFGDNKLSESCSDPTHIYVEPGTYKVRLSLTGPGGEDINTKTDFITAFEVAVADFSASPTAGGLPLTVSFTNLSTGDFDQCQWDFGDSNTSQSCDNPSHIYNEAGTYTVSLVIDGPGGEDQIIKEEYIFVSVAPKADFTVSPDEGVPPLIANFTNLSTGDFDECLWNFGDGRTSTTCDNLSLNYRDEGLFTVSLTVSGPAGDDTMTVEGCVKVAYIRQYSPVIMAEN